MNSKLPTATTVIEWIQAIESDHYFEQHASNPGMLLLRVKVPAEQYQGIHLALTTSGRAKLCHELKSLKKSTQGIYNGTCAFPKGRSWFNLYSSNLRTNSWFQFAFQLTKQTQKHEAMFEIHSAKVFIFLSAKALEKLCHALENPSETAKPLSIQLGRVPKPQAAPQSIWLWYWNKPNSS